MSLFLVLHVISYESPSFFNSGRYTKYKLELTKNTTHFFMQSSCFWRITIFLKLFSFSSHYFKRIITMYPLCPDTYLLSPNNKIYSMQKQWTCFGMDSNLDDTKPKKQRSRSNWLLIRRSLLPSGNYSWRVRFHLASLTTSLHRAFR